MKPIRSAVLAMVCVVALAFAAPALAASPAEEAYGGEASQIESGQTGSLPFTGIDVAGVLALGIVLVGAGFAVRRSARTSGD